MLLKCGLERIGSVGMMNYEVCQCDLLAQRKIGVVAPGYDDMVSRLDWLFMNCLAPCIPFNAQMQLILGQYARDHTSEITPPDA